MDAHVDIGGSEVLDLKGALLVYRGRNRGFVTWHEVRREDGESAPYLGEAQELTTEFVRQLAQGLGTKLPTEVFPDGVLARTAETIVWWTPCTIRPMFFAAHDAGAYKLNGKRLPQPPLVWKVSGRDLWVRALSENHRPTTVTQLMVAPYWNVDGETAWTCQGSMRSPDEFGVNSIPLVSAGAKIPIVPVENSPAPVASGVYRTMRQEVRRRSVTGERRARNRRTETPGSQHPGNQQTDRIRPEDGAEVSACARRSSGVWT